MSKLIYLENFGQILVDDDFQKSTKILKRALNARIFGKFVLLSLDDCLPWKAFAKRLPVYRF